MAVWIIDSRRGDDNFPGRARADRKPTDVGFADSDWDNAENETAPAAASVSGNTFTDTGKTFTDGAHLDHFVRFVTTGALIFTRRITATSGSTTFTFDGAAVTADTVAAYFIGGAKRSRSTLNGGGGLNVVPTAGDFFYLSGFFSGEAAVSMFSGSLGSGGTYDSYGSCFIVAAASDHVWLANYGSSVQGKFTILRLGMFSNPGFDSLHVMTDPNGGTFEIQECRDYGHGNLVNFFSGNPRLVRMIFTGNFARGTAIAGVWRKYSETDSNFSFRKNTSMECAAAANCNFGDGGFGGVVGASDNIFRSTAIRTAAHIIGVYLGDFDTFEVVDSPSQPLIKTTTQATFGTYQGTSPSSRMRVSNNPSASLPAGLGAIEFVDSQKRSGLILPSSLEIGTASDGGARGAFKAGVGVFGSAAQAFRIGVAGNPRSFSNLSSVSADLVEDGTTGGLGMNTLSTPPFSVTARFPFQGHTSNPAPPPAVSGVPTHIYNASGIVVGSETFFLAWDAGADLFIGSTPRDVSIRALLAIFSSVIASGSNFSIWDSTFGDGAITLDRILGWTSASGFTGAPAFNLTAERMFEERASALAARFIVFDITGRTE